MPADILGLPVSSAGQQEAVLPPCPGKTVWDLSIERWPDQATVRHLLDVQRERELDRSARPPVLQVNITDVTSPVSRLTLDPDAHTVAVTVRSPETEVFPAVIPEPSYPAPDLVFEDDTPTQAMAQLNGVTAELPAVGGPDDAEDIEDQDPQPGDPERETEH